MGLLIWRDEAAVWPQPIKPDHSTVRVPESLGFKLHQHVRDDEFKMVVWTGGWADDHHLLDGDVYSICPKFRDVDGTYGAVVREVAGYLACVAR